MGICPADCNLDDRARPGASSRAARRRGAAGAQFDPEPCDGSVIAKSVERHWVVCESGEKKTLHKARFVAPRRCRARMLAPRCGYGRRHRRAGRNRRNRGQAPGRPARPVTPVRHPPGPWPPGAMPSTCASARRRPCAAPSLIARLRRPIALTAFFLPPPGAGGTLPSIASIARCMATSWLRSERSSFAQSVQDSALRHR